jgi:bacteriocin-like protein
MKNLKNKLKKEVLNEKEMIQIRGGVNPPIVNIPD